MPCGWEGNRRSGVALAMRQTSAIYPPTGLRPQKGRRAPRLALLMGYATPIPLPQRRPIDGNNALFVKLSFVIIELDVGLCSRGLQGNLMREYACTLHAYISVYRLFVV